MASVDSKAPDSEERQKPTMDDLVMFVDSEFKPGSYWRRIRYHWLDLFLAGVVLLVVVIVMNVLVLAAAQLSAEGSNVATVLAYFAVVLALLQFAARWMETPSRGDEDYWEDLVEENCEELSKKHKIENDLVLYALVSMKIERPEVMLAEVKKYAPEMFSSSVLVSRLYRAEARQQASLGKDEQS